MNQLTCSNLIFQVDVLHFYTSWCMAQGE